MFYGSEMLEDIGEVLSIESVTVRGCPAPVCRPAQHQEALLAPYTEAENRTFTDCCLLLPAQGTYTPSLQELGSQHAHRLHVTADAPVSFFQWQIQQEEEKLAALSPAELIARDADGDT